MKKILILVALLAVALTACGGDEKKDYVKAVNAAQERGGNIIANLSAGVDPSSPREADAPIYDQQADALRSLASDVGKIKVPDGLQNAHDAFKQAILAFAQDVQNADTMSDQQFAQVMQIDTRRAQQAIDTLNDKL